MFWAIQLIRDMKLKIVLDDGERDLWAFVVSSNLPASWFLCGPDKASMRFGHDAKFRDNMTCLEEMAEAIGHKCRPPLSLEHTKKWLDGFMLELTMGVRTR